MSDVTHMIASIATDSPAERAGMQPGEQVLAINGHELKDIFDLFFCQSCRRLVEDNDLCLMRDCLGDLAHLLLSYSQVAHFGFGVDIDMKLIKELFGFFDHSAVIDHEPFFEFTPDKNILRYSQVAHHVQFLMYDDDTCRLCFVGVVEFNILSLKGYGAGIFGINTGKNLHECGLAGAVFTHQRVHFSLSQLKIHMIQRVDAGEGFVDAFHCQNNFAHFPSPFRQFLRRLAETSA